MAPTTTPLPVTTLDQHRAAAHAALAAGRRDLVHWAAQAAYARVRADYPRAHRLHIDTAERLEIARIVTVEGDELYQRIQYGVQADDALEPVDELLDTVLAHSQPQQLPPGWRLVDVRYSVFEVTLNAVPAAVQVELGQRDELGYYPAPSGLAGLVAAGLDLLLPPYVRAAREYARGLVEGRYHPLDHLPQWPRVPRELGYPVPFAAPATLDPGNPLAADPAADDQRAERSDVDQLDAEDWQVGIAFVHGLAAGVVESLDTDDTIGTETPLYMRITVYDEALAAAGLTLPELAAAFAGDVRAAAVAVMQARPNDEADLVVACRGCHAPVSPRDAHRFDAGWLGACCWPDTALDPDRIDARRTATTGTTDDPITAADTATATDPARNTPSRRYTVIGLDEKDTCRLRIAAVLEGEHRTVDEEPERPVVLFERWLEHVSATSPEHAEIVAQQVYHYGGVVEHLPAAQVRAGHLLVDEDTQAATLIDAVDDRDDYVLLRLEGEVRGQMIPRGRLLAVVTAEGA